MVGEGEARRLEVDEIQRALEPFDFAAQVGRDEAFVRTGALDLPALSLGGDADACVP
jgi:hypothetical protein